MILFVDTISQNDKLVLALLKDGKVLNSSALSIKGLSEQLLLNIEKFLNKNKVKFGALKKIAVCTGPGGFSNSRIAVATANALAWSLGISVTGVKRETIVKDLPSVLKKAKWGRATEPLYKYPAVV